MEKSPQSSGGWTGASSEPCRRAHCPGSLTQDSAHRSAEVWPKSGHPMRLKPLALGHWQLEALRLEGISNVSISDFSGMLLLPIGNMLRKTRRDNIDYSPMRQPSGQRSSVARPCKSASLSNVDSPIRALTLRNRRRNKGEQRMLEHSKERWPTKPIDT